MREIIAKARKTVPWPIRETLSDGSIRCSGLTEDEINAHLARVIIEELRMLPLDLPVVQAAARAIFEAESDHAGLPHNEAQYVGDSPVYRMAALTGFRAILAELRKGL